MRSVYVRFFVIITVSTRCNAERDRVLSAGERTLTDDEAEYRAFRDLHGRSELDTVSFEERLANYQRWREAVQQHNAQPGASWKASINQFADYTEAEFKRLLGHRRTRRTDGGETSSFLQTAPRRHFAHTIDWSRNLSSVIGMIREQGSCGSCWAAAAVGALEIHVEKVSGKQLKLSSNQVKDCAPNPRHCGGTGGCEGSTSELAYDYISKKGFIAADHAYGGNKNKDEECKHDGDQLKMEPYVEVQKFVQLPVNKLEPLMQALNHVGPVVVSIDATGWGMYSSGIFDGCKPDAIVDHAVVCTGYGTDSGKDYWTIRNSWGGHWGERGFIRLLRHSSDTGAEGFCGKDKKPKEGVGCDGGPDVIDVCGMCGVLSDTCYPDGVRYHSPGSSESAISYLELDDDLEPPADDH